MTSRCLVAIIALLAMAPACRKAAAPGVGLDTLEGAFVLVAAGKGRSLAIPVRAQAGDADPREDAWFLLDGDGAREIARDLSCMYTVHEAARSRDGRFLAVLSLGEGHPCLQVIDLVGLLAGRGTTRPESLVLTTINPYPGSIGIKAWDGGRLVVESDSLLTVRDGGGNVPGCLTFGGFEEYALDPTTGVLAPLTPGALHPETAFLASQHQDPDALLQRACALRWLRGTEALPELRALRERLPDGSRAQVDELIGELTSAGSAAGRENGP